MQRLVTVVIILVVAAGTISARANLLDYKNYAYVDSSNKSWWGDTSYSDFSLSGSVEWVVFGPGQFNLAFPASPYHPPATELVYAYQIDNVGTSDTSTLDVAIVAGRSVDTVGFFPLTYSGSNAGMQPSSSTFVPSPPSYQFAHWSFQGGILTGQSSSGLAYASAYVPENQFGSLANSGLGADADPLPSPSTTLVPFPEPATTALLLVSALAIGLKWKLRRWSSN
jgi:hypothetical protein